jgi:hypothetical protein
MYWVLGLLGLGAGIALALWLWWLWKKRLGLSGSRGPSGFGGAGYSVWRFERGNWSLLEDRSAPGFVPGPPPSEPGLFDGYCMKVASIQALRAP